MTHQEIREEMKELQGDPQIIARRRAGPTADGHQPHSSTVPKADVIVTNPTELAVAIQYDPLEMAAPIVVAKGAGVLAQRIRRLGLESKHSDRRAEAAGATAVQGRRRRQTGPDRIVRRGGGSAGLRLPAQRQKDAGAAAGGVAIASSGFVLSGGSATPGDKQLLHTRFLRVVACRLRIPRAIQRDSRRSARHDDERPQPLAAAAFSRQSDRSVWHADPGISPESLSPKAGSLLCSTSAINQCRSGAVETVGLRQGG